MKTLAIIQKISKIAKILSTIAFIASIIGVVGCIIGIITLSFMPQSIFSLGAVQIHGIVEASDSISKDSAYTAMAVAMIICAGEAVLAKISERYFKSELEDGTPFTLDGANKLKRFGICSVAIPIGTAIAANITYEIMKSCLDHVADINIDNSMSIGIGIMLIFISLLCRYGAELTENKSASVTK